MTAADAYHERLQQRLDRRAEDAEYANLLRSARLHHLLTDRTPFQRVTDELTDGCGCACHTGTGYRSSCDHCQPDRGPLFDLAADLARQEAGHSVKVHPLGDRLTLVRDNGAA